MTKCFISLETRDEEPRVFYWNRRKAVWQKYLTVSCVYPTERGCKSIWKDMAHVNWPYIDGRPVRTIAYKPL